MPAPKKKAGSGSAPTPREAKQAATKKAQPRVTNGGAAGNARDPMETSREALPHGDSPGQTPGRKIARPSTPRCGAQNRQGQPCGNAAGFKTDHPGTGRCHLHGGLSPAPTGRYSTVNRARVQELLHQFMADPDPLNLLPEAALLRALLTEFIERFDDQDRQLTRWNLSFEKSFQSDWANWWRDLRADAIEREDDLSSELLAQMPDPMSYLPSKPLRMADITEVGSLIDKVGVMIERVRKARSTDTFSMQTVDNLWTAMSAHLTQAMLEVIEDHDLRERLHTSVAEKWGTISLAELARNSTPEGPGEG